jgi:hypothetical protein
MYEGNKRPVLRNFKSFDYGPGTGSVFILTELQLKIIPYSKQTETHMHANFMRQFLVERKLCVKIVTATSLTDIRRYTSWWCIRWHHGGTWHRRKPWRRWRVALCRIEHGHPTRWRWHARGHSNAHGGHWDPDWRGPRGLHRRLHGHGCESRRRRGRCGQCTSELALVRAREARHGLYGAISRRGRAGGQRERVVLSGLRCQQSFCGCAVALALAVLFEGILDRDGLVHEELPVHGLDGRVGGFKVRVGHETITLRLACLRIARNLIGRVSKVYVKMPMRLVPHGTWKIIGPTFAVVAIIPNALNVS